MIVLFYISHILWILGAAVVWNDFERGCPILLRGQSSHKPPLEPVGGSSPKFPTLTSTLTPSMASALPFSLSCPAQGAPVPSYRPVQLFCFRASRWISPKVLGTLKQLNFDHSPFYHSLSCPAQGSPVPAYRPVLQ